MAALPPYAIQTFILDINDEGEGEAPQEHLHYE